MTEPQAHFTLDRTIPVFARWIGSWQFSVQRRLLNLPELTRRYDRSAADWHRIVDRFGFPAAYASMLRQVLGSETPTTVLDCGAGTGALSQALIEAVPGPLALTALDASSQMLEQAHHALRDSGADVTLRRADATALPYDDDTFDMVMTAHMVEHLVDPALALAEMVRVLKPGGRLIICVTRRTLLGMMVHLKWHTHRMTPNQTRHLLRNAGLQSVESLTYDQAPWCRRLSLACTGRKPV